MDKQNKNFKEVLDTAKKLGYAESNPSADLNGDDVSAKLKILSSLCFNSFLNNNIHVEGINNIDKDDIENANKLGEEVENHDQDGHLHKDHCDFKTQGATTFTAGI